MKKAGSILIFIVIFIGCSEPETMVEYDPIPLEDKIELASDIIIKVDPRVELLSVVQHFTTWANKQHTKYESRYKQEVQRYFEKYSNHRAISLSQELTQNGFSYDAPPNFVLYHNQPPEFVQEVEYTDYLIGRAGGLYKIQNFAKELKNFAVETDFMIFIESQKSYFRKIENDIKRTIGDQDYIKIIEEYYGYKQNSYSVIPTSLFHHGGYGALVMTDEGNNIYNICGPVNSTEGMPSFGDEAALQYILLHEFSHSFVNPLADQYKTRLDSSTSLFEPIRTQMKKIGYGTWRTCVNEHLVRTNVARFFNQLEGVDAKNKILKQEYDKGFIYINVLDSLMQIYESNREEYLTYNDFYPVILNYFDAIK